MAAGKVERLLYSIPEVCEATGLSRTTINSAMRDGSLKKRHFGKAVRIHVNDLRRWIDAKTIGVA